MKDSVRRYWLEFNTPLEGHVYHMYLDSEGRVSAGVGNLIDATKAPKSPPSPVERASSLGLANQFQWTRTDGNAAGPQLVANDWDAVKLRLDLARSGHRAFEALTQLRLTDDEIERMMFVKVDQMEATLKSRNEFADFDAWPADAQLGLLSMSWGMGPGFTLPTFQEYASQGKWADAATECRFQCDEGTIKVRNIVDAQCFRNAGRVAAEGYDPEQLVVDLTHVFGVQIALLHFGFDPGPTDGAPGPRTTAAVTHYQNASGLAPTGNPKDVTAQLAVALTGDGFTALTT
jgi:GH24 family phage-related lysozyme (muramidase)